MLRAVISKLFEQACPYTLFIFSLSSPWTNIIPSLSSCCLSQLRTFISPHSSAQPDLLLGAPGKLPTQSTQQPASSDHTHVGQPVSNLCQAYQILQLWWAPYFPRLIHNPIHQLPTGALIASQGGGSRPWPWDCVFGFSALKASIQQRATGPLLTQLCLPCYSVFQNENNLLFGNLFWNK